MERSDLVTDEMATQTPPIWSADTAKLKLWFFRDLNDEQRLKLFSLHGFPVEEMQQQSMQYLAFTRLFPSIPASRGAETPKRNENLAREVHNLRKRLRGYAIEFHTDARRKRDFLRAVELLEPLAASSSTPTAIEGAPEAVAWTMPSALEQLHRFGVHNVQLVTEKTDLCTEPLYSEATITSLQGEIEGLRNSVQSVVDTMEFNARHMIAEDSLQDAWKMLDMAKEQFTVDANQLRSALKGAAQ